ncbi:MAG: nickel pincer cofactor biosynthesis protein LarB [Planctomycetota bacterium]|nr:nickel pincer cofactor biosynthesis protein LarB [Planctomycetota bacterium]
MRREDLERLFEEVRSGSCTPAEAAERLAQLPFVAAGDVLVDTHRELRTGAPEAVFAQGKTPQQCADAAAAIAAAHRRVLVTRANEATAAAVRARLPGAEWHAAAGCLLWRAEEPKRHGRVAVVSAGTSDQAVAEEAALTADFHGAVVDRIADVGVAGLQRLIAHLERFRTADCLVAVAGMEGALPSVLAGLVAVPVLAVPTSVGYGASYGGLAALLAMLNSCAPGVAVLNVDNGFGAGFLAARICQMARRLHP